MSIKNSLLFLVRSEGEASIDDIKILADGIGHKQSCLERRARELCNEGQIMPRYATTKDGVRYISGYYAT